MKRASKMKLLADQVITCVKLTKSSRGRKNGNKLVEFENKEKQFGSFKHPSKRTSHCTTSNKFYFALRSFNSK